MDGRNKSGHDANFWSRAQTPKNLMLSLSKHADHTLALRQAQAQGEGVFGVRTKTPPVMPGLDPGIHVYRPQ